MKHYIKMRLIQATSDKITIPTLDDITREDDIPYNDFNEARSVINGFIHHTQIFPISRTKPGKKYVGISIWDDDGKVEDEILFRMNRKVVKYFGLRVFTTFNTLIKAVINNIILVIMFLSSLGLTIAFATNGSWFLSIFCTIFSCAILTFLISYIVDEVIS